MLYNLYEWGNKCRLRMANIDSMLKMRHIKGLKRCLQRKKMVVLGKSPKVIVEALKWKAKTLVPTIQLTFYLTND